MIATASLLLGSGVGASAQPKVPFKYAPPRCAQPHFSVLPQAQDSQAPDQAKASYYDYEVRQYNREVEAYSRCIKNYVAKADRDARKIQEDAAAEAKRITETADASAAVIHAQIRKATASVRKLSGKPAGDARGGARSDGAR
ncbi:MAG TPA: hypothetical protein VGM68_09560 [Rhizomicrobium sp.]|jgi:hypothetical protein